MVFEYFVPITSLLVKPLHGPWGSNFLMGQETIAQAMSKSKAAATSERRANVVVLLRSNLTE